MERIPILLDTDAGSDIDDAVALAYLLRQPRCELLGITTVSGDVQQRAAICEVVCAAAGRDDVPIHLGRREPLLDGPGQPKVPHYAAISDRPHRVDRPENMAVEFLRQTIRSRPGEITLLTIGPYSNIALLFALDPEIPFLVKEIVSMGGDFFGVDRQEWNIKVDLAASAMVYRAPRASHLSVGLDVTEKCTMTHEEVSTRFVGEPLATVRAMAEHWFTHAGRMTFHDPLAAALIFRPELCSYVSGMIDCRDGLTRLQEGEGPDRVAKTVDSDAFFDEFMGVFTASS
jgi:purine nucleosidase